MLGGDERRARSLELLDDRQRRVDVERTGSTARDEPGYPFCYPEQDVLNAILDTRLDPTRLDAPRPTASRPTPPFAGLRVRDDATLRLRLSPTAPSPTCSTSSSASRGSSRCTTRVYSRLLARLLLGHDVAIRVPEEDGAAAHATRRAGPRSSGSSSTSRDLSRWYWARRSALVGLGGAAPARERRR